MPARPARPADEPAWRPRPTLGGRDYASPAVYDEERERVFWGGWICIGRCSGGPGPGDYLVRDLAGESVVVVRNRAGRAARLLQRVRPPRHEAPRRRTRLRSRRQGLQVPVHAWSYDLDGRLVATPNVDEDELFERVRLPAPRDGRRAIRRLPVRRTWPRRTRPLARAPPRQPRDDHRLRPLSDGRARASAGGSPRGRRELEDRRRELQRVPALPDRSTRSSCRSCRSPDGEVWDGETRDGGSLMVEGATSVHLHRPAPACRSSPGSSPTTTGMYYGVFQFPNLMVNLHPDSVLAYLVSPNGPATDRRSCPSSSSARRRSPLPGFDPSPTVELLGPRQPPGLGGLRAGPARRVVSRLRGRRLPAAGPLAVRFQRAVAHGDGSPQHRLIANTRRFREQRARGTPPRSLLSPIPGGYPRARSRERRARRSPGDRARPAIRNAVPAAR